MMTRPSADHAGWRDAEASRLEKDFTAAREESRTEHAKTSAARRNRHDNPLSGKETDMTVSNLNDLFVETLTDLYCVKENLVKTLPRMAQKASSENLKQAIQNHISETEIHVQRLEQVFELLDQKASAKICEALEGLIREAEEVMGEIADEQTLEDEKAVNQRAAA